MMSNTGLNQITQIQSTLYMSVPNAFPRQLKPKLLVVLVGSILCSGCNETLPREINFILKLFSLLPDTTQHCFLGYLAQII